MAFKFTSIYGAINLKYGGDYDRAVNFLKALGEDGHYPFINTNMFSFGDYEVPFYYHNMILSFAATYKGFGLDLVDWNNLILKLEHILRNIDFEITQFHIDSYLGDYTITWIDKDELSSNEHLSERYQLKKTDEWYFGYGERNMQSGILRQELKKSDTLEDLFIGFNYPIIFDPEAIRLVQLSFNETSHLPIGSIIDARLKFGNPLRDRVDEVLYSLVLAGKIQFADDLGREKIIIHAQPWYM